MLISHPPSAPADDNYHEDGDDMHVGDNVEDAAEQSKSRQVTYCLHNYTINFLSVVVEEVMQQIKNQ